MPIEHKNVTSVHRGGYVGNTDPGAVGAHIFWTNTTYSPARLLVRNATNTAWLPVGEVNGAVNVGTGSQVYKQLNGTNMELRTIKGSDTIDVTQNASDLTVSVKNHALYPFTEDWYNIDQTGTGNLDVTALYATIINISETGFIIWQRNSAGNYTAFYPYAALSSLSTQAIITYGENINDPTTDGIIVHAYVSGATSVEIRSFNAAGAPADLNVKGLKLVLRNSI